MGINHRRMLARLAARQRPAVQAPAPDSPAPTQSPPKWPVYRKYDGSDDFVATGKELDAPEMPSKPEWPK